MPPIRPITRGCSLPPPRCTKELDRLSAIYQTPAAGLLAAATSGVRPASLGGTPSGPAALAGRSLPAGLTADELRQAAGLADLSAAGRGALGQLDDLGQQAQVICIVRPLADPKAKPEVVILDCASATFLEQLANEQLKSSRQ